MLLTANFEKTKKRSTPSPFHLCNEDIIYEILTWLPAKSLMRFKRISKFWNTKIARDSYFMQLHRRRAGARSGGEKLLLHLTNDIFDSEHTFVSVDRDGRNHVLESYTHSCPYQEDRVKVVDGLVCFYSERGPRLSSSLHNLSTHESIALPEISNFNNLFCKRSFLFVGFDSSHTLCKILRRTKLIDNEIVFEIYTVGTADNSWRIINSPPFECDCCYPYDSGVCVNGVIYWISWCLTTENNRCKGFKIKAFDVSDEKFYLISIPPDCSVDHLRNINGVLTLVGKLSVLSCSDYEIKIWKLEDYKNQVWVMDSILIDYASKLLTWRDNSVLVGTIGSGKIWKIQQLAGAIVALIYHDRSRRVFKVAELENYTDNHPGTYVENIMPLTSISN